MFSVNTWIDDITDSPIPGFYLKLELAGGKDIQQRTCHLSVDSISIPGFLNSVDFRADGGMIYCLYFVMLTLCGDYTLLNGKANMKSLFNLGRNNCRWERTIKTFKREVRGNVSVRPWLTVYENLCKTETGLIGSFHDEDKIFSSLNWICLIPNCWPIVIAQCSSPSPVIHWTKPLPWLRSSTQFDLKTCGKTRIKWFSGAFPEPSISSHRFRLHIL